MERIPFGEARVTVTKNADDSVKASISMSDHTYEHYLVYIAKKRGLGVCQTIIEALRLELLFSRSLDDPEKGLYMVPDGEQRPRRLVSV